MDALLNNPKDCLEIMVSDPLCCLASPGYINLCNFYESKQEVNVVRDGQFFLLSLFSQKFNRKPHCQNFKHRKRYQK